MTLTGTELVGRRFEPGSESWLTKISATQAVTICGLNPPTWETPNSLWVAKRCALEGRPIPERSSSDAMTRGQEHEPLILGHLRKRQPDWNAQKSGVWQHKIRDWQIASPDAMATVDDQPACIEIKSVHPTMVSEWSDGAPHRVQAQVQWQMDVTGARLAYVVMESGFEFFDQRPRIIEVKYDEQIAARMREAAVRFMQSLELGIPPEADYALEADRNALRWQHPRLEAVPPVELPDDLAIPYLTALADTKRIEGAKSEWSAKIAAYLGDRKTASWRGTTLGARKNGAGGKPPVFSAAPKLADKATQLLDTTQENAA